MQAVWDRSGEVYLSLTLRQSRQGIATIFPEDGSIKPWQQWDGLKQQIETLEASIEFFSSYSARTSSCSIYIYLKKFDTDAGSLKAAIYPSCGMHFINGANQNYIKSFAPVYQVLLWISCIGSRLACLCHWYILNFVGRDFHWWGCWSGSTYTKCLLNKRNLFIREWLSHGLDFRLANEPAWIDLSLKITLVTLILEAVRIYTPLRTQLVKESRNGSNESIIQ